MSVAILGDLSLSKMVKSESFKTQLAVDYASYQVRRQYSTFRMFLEGQ